MKLNFLSNLFKKSTSESFDKNKDITTSNDLKASEVLIEKGKAKANQKDYSGAINDFSKAIELDPKSISAYWQRSKAKRELNDIPGADKDFQNGNILYENLDNGLKANDEGNSYYEDGDYKNAIRCYNKAIPLIPTIKTIYYYRGLSKQYLKDYNGAMEDFNKSIEVNASNKADSYYERSLLKSHNFDDKVGALQDLNDAIEINPNEAEYYYSRAKLQDEYDGLQDLTKAIELDSENPDYYLSRSLNRKKMEDYEGSIADLTKFIEINQDSYITITEAYSLRAGMRLLSNDLQGALKDHDNAVKTDPTNSDAVMERGIIKDLLRDYEGAIIDFSKAIELNPKNAQAFYERGVVRQNIGLEDEGVMDVIKAKVLGYEE